eukprot:6183666-Pleurochrysis_carterae.AAC.5
MRQVPPGIANRSVKLAKGTYILTYSTRYVSTHSCELLERAHNGGAGGRASGSNVLPTHHPPLTQGVDLWSGRTRGAGQRERLGSSHRSWGVAPGRPSERLWRACAPGKAKSTHPTGP